MVDHAKANALGWARTIMQGMRSFQRLESGEARKVKLDGDEFDDVDALRQRLEEMPLSIRVRDDWRAVGDDSGDPVEFEILLSTGGPALRIVGDLDECCQPVRCELQYQDWGTPWKPYRAFTETLPDALQAFAGLFYYGEG